jgi:hypothetical protein
LNSAAKQSKAKQSKNFFQGLNIFSSESEVQNFIFQLARVCVFLVGFLHESDP